MRIGFVCERMLTGFGVDLTVDHLATGLTEKGHDVTVYCSVDDGTYRGRDYRIRLIPTRPSRNFPLMERRARKWATLLDEEGLDVVEIHTFPFFRLIPLLKTPVVAVDHGISPTEGMPFWLRTDFDYVRSRLYGSYLPAAAGLVTISEFLRSQLPTALRERAQVIPWGSDHYFRPVPRAEALEWRRGLGVDDDAVLSLYVGRLNHKGQPYKGVEELLEHFAGLKRADPRAALVCIGFGDERDARDIRLAGAIPVLKAPPAAMPLAYAAADIFVTASKWEGFGLPLLEAERAGVACLAYGRGAHPEIARAGESALLVETKEQFASCWRQLTGDQDARQRLGREAEKFARGLSWDRAVGAHEQVLAATAGQDLVAHRGTTLKMRRKTAPNPDPTVSVVVLTYRPEPDTIANCLDTVLASDYARVEVLVVDNGSGDGVAEAAAKARGVRYLPLDANLGFSAGINRGVAAASGELVFILNPDTEVDPGAVSALVDAARRHPDAVGFAAKMLFLHDRELLDSVGVAMDEWGAAFNRGIGQLDIGQYDQEERVMGACFGATLIRKEAFQSLRVGPLDERYFLYYEDVDWCVRATLLGEDFWTAPAARVYHVHSGTTREQAYAFKYRHIERNLMYTVFKNFEKRRVLKIFYRRSRAHLNNLRKRQYPVATMRVLFGGWLGVAKYWDERHTQQRRRVRPDLDWLKLSHGELPYFNPVRYSPIYGWPTLLAMVKRLWLVTEEERWERAYVYLQAAEGSVLKYRPRQVLAHLQSIAAPLPPPLERFFEVLAEEPGMLEPEDQVAVELESDLGPGEGARTA